MRRSGTETTKGETPRGLFLRPQGVPRGFLRQYILHSIAEKPAHGYDLLREIGRKTEGSWRPGAGSIYPVLKELVAGGYIRPEPPSRSKGSQRVYHITRQGEKALHQSSNLLAKAGQNWGAMRRILIELIDPPQVPSLFTHMVTGQFQFVRDILESKKDKIPPREVKSLLGEYALNLGRQLEWTNSMLGNKKRFAEVAQQ